MLSKSRYLKGLKCHKALWLYQHKREDAYYPPSTEQFFAAGNQAGEIAQDFFLGGELALVDDYPNSAAALRTQELIALGITTIYEATFIANHTLVALDILHQIDGKWYAFEVKSTNSVKEEHVRDAAIQYYVIQDSGLELEDISIMHFDKTYVRRGEINPKELFTYESVKHRIDTYLKEIPENIETFIQVFKQDEPTIIVGEHCEKPYGCEFANYCSKLPENQELLNAKKDIEPLSTEVNFVDKKGIQSFLNSTIYPVYSLDFETIMYGIPEFDESRPYQQIPFQYSLHVQHEPNGTIDHFEFLGDGKEDPREDLIKSMLASCGTHGSILVYNIPFERTRINELIRDFSQYADELEKIKERLVDLLPVFRKLIKTPVTSKSASLKVVLPTFLPEQKDYSDLNIQQGLETVEVYRQLSKMTENDTVKARKKMLEYCKMDTKSVLDLFNLLRTYI